MVGGKLKNKEGRGSICERDGGVWRGEEEKGFIVGVLASDEGRPVAKEFGFILIFYWCFWRIPKWLIF